MIKRFLIAVAILAAVFTSPAIPQSTMQTFFYVATAIDVGGRESVYSNEVQALVPQQGSHTVSLTCTQPASSAVGFNFYRGNVSGGSYARQNGSPVTACAFVDTFSPPPAPTLAAPVVK